jgi:hypothetical protein
MADLRELIPKSKMLYQKVSLEVATPPQCQFFAVPLVDPRDSSKSTAASGA